MSENTSAANNLRKTTHSNAGLAQIVVRVAEAAQADAMICTTETGAFAQHLQGCAQNPI